MGNTSSKIKTIFLIFFALIIIAYSAFQSQKLLSGPVIKIISPQNGTTFNQALIEIEGSVKNVSKINLNGRQIFTNQNGYFKEKVLLSPGYNVIKIEAQDKFKNGTEKILDLVLKEY